MKFLLQLTPNEVRNLPERLQSIVLEQLPRKMRIESLRLERIEMRLNEDRANLLAWNRFNEQF